MVHKKLQIATRVAPEKYNEFKRLCHSEFRQMADVTRQLIEDWMEKKKRRLK